MFSSMTEILAVSQVYEIITQKIEFGISNGEVQAYSKLKKERKKGWFW